jgi:hypothetical protein
MNVLLISSSQVMNVLIHRILKDDNITQTTNGNINIPSDTDLILVEESLMTDNFINSPKPGVVITTDPTDGLINRISDHNKTYVVKPFNGEQLNSRIQQVIG